MSPVRASIRIYLYTFVSLWAVALLAVVVRGFVLHSGYPYDTFLFRPPVRFTDFTIFDPRFAIWDGSESFYAVPGFPFTYPAPLLACFLAYWKLTPHPLTAYLATVIVFAVGAVARLGISRPALRLPVGVTLLGAYPLMFLLDRANIEGLVWIAAATGIWAFARRRFTTSAILLGLAAGMKIFPAALLLLFWKKRRYRYFPVAVAAAILCSVIGLAIAGPSIPAAFRHMLAGMDFFRHFEVLTHRPDQIGFEHSLFSCLKQTMHFLLQSSSKTNELLPSMCLPYLVIVGSAFLLLYIFAIRKLPVLNQLFALTACSILLPFISYDYTLVHMYIPWAAFMIFLTADVASGRAVLPVRHALAFLIPCAILFAPLSWMLFRDSGCGGQVKALALVALIAAAVKIPLPSSLFGDLKRTAIRTRREVQKRILEPEAAFSLS